MYTVWAEELLTQASVHAPIQCGSPCLLYVSMHTDRISNSVILSNEYMFRY